MSEAYEKARAIAEAAANRWDKFGDMAGVAWLADQVMGFGAAHRDVASADVGEPCECNIGQCHVLTKRCREIAEICEQDARDQDFNGSNTGDKQSKAYAEGRGGACRSIAARLRGVLSA